MGRTLVLAVVAAMSFSVAGWAQDRPATEIYVGFPILFGENSSQLFGVHGNVTFPVRHWFGIGGDAAFHVGEVYAEKSLITALGGPVFSVHAGSRMRIFGQALLGVGNSGCGEFQNGCQSATVFSSAIGGGVYLRAGRRSGFRVSGDDLATNFGGNPQHYLRLSFGVAFGIGE